MIEEPEEPNEAKVEVGAESDPSADGEEDAKQKALQLEAQDGGHSIARHGPEVIDSALEQRLKTGIAPDRVLNPTSASTKFASYTDWVKTREDALKAIAIREGIDLTKPPLPGTSKDYSIVLEHGRPIDDGFVGAGSATRVQDAVSGKKFKVYAATQRVDGLTRTRTSIEWSDTAQKWQVKQHYPDARGWDATSGTYTQPV